MLFRSYVDSNLLGFSHLMLSAINHAVPNVIYASSSSVYGEQEKEKFKEEDKGLEPLSFYGATKLANEILATALAKNSQTKFRGLRFFTVYGPWGRPDMAYFRLVAAAVLGRPFTLFGNGSITRDFTFISDAVQAIVLLSDDLSERKVGFSDVVILGGGHPYSMNDLISSIEISANVKIEIDRRDKFSSDVPITNSDASYLNSLVHFVPNTSLLSGVSQCIEWAKDPAIESNLLAWLE